ncbi:SDR family NAD(P)-dependent oxidoreductase [Pseudomonas sp. MYb185]|uniref:SDR family NAD(P)-dependent oxidoreductase n=1 Tax=Pseudomonas sp. MYb185 TaxID=1848729 RepID=UPI0021154125|nr:SDR family oxidoreductase [Pseudomonas sp. MYb185]
MSIDRGLALVTGACGAIGKACCERLLAEGYRVLATDMQPGSSLPAQVSFRGLDVTDEQAVARLVEEGEARYGQITALVNVAGVVSRGRAIDLPVAEVERVWRINVLGTLIVCQQVGQRMAARGRGAIVNIGSVVGKNAGNARPWLDPSELERAGNVAYGMSKSAIHTLTGFLAKELASQGVRVNAVAPGPIATQMTDSFPESLRALVPAGRMGTPEEVAHAVHFLLDERSGFISGEIIDVNGALWCD